MTFEMKLTYLIVKGYTFKLQQHGVKPGLFYMTLSKDGRGQGVSILRSEFPKVALEALTALEKSLDTFLEIRREIRD